MTKAFSYIRFSTPNQKLGDSERRQVERTAKYCAEHGLTLDESLRDEGLSGYHGVHRRRGALGRFVERVKRGEIERGTVLIVETFDRLSRQTPRQAQEQFLTLINAGIDVVTLIDGQRFSAESVDANPGQLFMSVGMMMGAHAESKHKADRIRETWIKRRNSPQNNLPCWIERKTLKLDGKNSIIVQRIVREAPSIGLYTMARTMNQQGVRFIYSGRKRSRQDQWDKAVLSRIIRGKAVLGLQQVGRYENGRRILTEQWIKAYEAAVTEDEWLAANAALDQRTVRGGARAGRNIAAGYTNLFGELLQCGACGSTMRVRGRSARTGLRAYFGCASAGNGACDHKSYHQIGKVEETVLKTFGGLAYQPDPENSTNAAHIAKIDSERVRLRKALDGLAERFGDGVDNEIASAMMRLSDRLKSLETERKSLERTHPPHKALDALQRFLNGLDGLQGEELIEARRRIATTLPSILQSVMIHPGGRMVAKLGTGAEIELDGRRGHPARGAITVGTSINRPGAPPKPHAAIPYPVPSTVLEAAGKRSVKALAAFKREEAAARKRQTAQNPK